MTCDMLGFPKVFLSGFNFESNALSMSGTKSCTESIKRIILLLPCCHKDTLVSGFNPLDKY